MDSIVKCVVVGDRRVDTTRVIISYTTGQYPEYRPAALDNYNVTAVLDEKPYFLAITDAGEEDMIHESVMGPTLFRTDVFVVCFSVVNPMSYDNVRAQWIPMLKHYSPNTPIILVGTKLEKRDDEAKVEKLKAYGLKPVTYAEGLKLRREIGAVKYHECSARTQEGVKEVFDDAIRAVVMPSLFEDLTEKYLRVALKDGYIPHKDDVFLIHGPGGVGKSSLISMFLGKQRDLARVSTAVADESLNVCPVRDVSTSMFTDKWEVVDIDRQARMVAHTSQHLLCKEKVTGPSTEKKEMKVENKSINIEKVGQPLNKSPEENKNPSAFLKSNKGLPRIASKFASKFSSLFKKTLTKSLGDDPENIEVILSNIQERLQDIMLEPSKHLDLMLYYCIRLLDSGGQPQFHEVVSIILPAVTGIISVFKLSERLDVHGEVVFYKKGELANNPYKSYLTNEQVIRHDLLALQSEACHRSINEMPNLAFVGTHLDQQDSCADETPDQKDKLLHSMITEILPEDLQQCIITNGDSLQHVTFRLNTRTPTGKDYETAKHLKDALMSKSQVTPKNLPLKWCGYEVALRKLMESLGRQTLSLQECEFVGYKLGFDMPSLTACLKYLRELHIISFYDILPNVIFGSCQVILDKITELIIYSLELKKGNRPLTGVDRNFVQQGILSLDIIQSETCSKHYSTYFTPECLLNVLKSLFIITKVGQEYFMPCVLEVSDIFPPPPPSANSVQSSFILHFSKNSPMLGIYCCTVSYLLTKAGWRLLSKGGEVVQVARNSVTFQLPRNLPGKLTFLDPLSSYFEVVLEFSAVIFTDHSANLYREIKDTFVVAIQQAMGTLHYEVKKPELSFLCLEQSSQCSTFPHISIVDPTHSFLTCSISPDIVVHPLTPDQKIWLDGIQSKEQRSPKRPTVAAPLTITGERPNMLQLIDIDLPSRVGEKFNVFGTLLLQDEYGNKMENIMEQYWGRPERITMTVLREWLAGKGVEVSWESLIATLRKSKLQLMADQIQIALENRNL